jgi:hypothetical protein
MMALASCGANRCFHYQLSLNKQTCSTKIQPFSNHLNNLTPSKPLAPTLQKSDKMFFQNVTPFMLTSNTLSMGLDGCPPTLTHLNNLLANLAQIPFASFAEIAANRAK